MADEKTTPTEAEIPETTATAGEKTFTQSELDRITGTRLARQEKSFEAKRADHIADFLAEKGLDADALEKLVDGNSSEKEREARELQRNLKKAHSELEGIKAERDQLSSRLSKKLVRETVTTAALSAGAGEKQVTAVRKMLASELGVMDGEVVVLNDDGKPSDKTVETLVSELLKDNPYLLAPSNTKGGSGAGKPAQDPGSGEKKSRGIPWDTSAQEAREELRKLLG